MRFARASGLDISIRGGGHNVAGRAVVDGALMIDLAEMKGIHVDPARGRVRAQGGVLWRELNRESAAHGLAVDRRRDLDDRHRRAHARRRARLADGEVRARGRQRHGVELVTADGTILERRRRSRDPDLFWALRGGGGNFGIAASFEYRLHPLR